MTESLIPFGFFSEADQETPEYDPGVDGVECPACDKALTRDDLRTISLMETGGRRSLFYRLHRSCAMRITRDQKLALDERVMQQAGQAGGGIA
jgi:hypothetical protein